MCWMRAAEKAADITKCLLCPNHQHRGCPSLILRGTVFGKRYSLFLLEPDKTRYLHTTRTCLTSLSINRESEKPMKPEQLRKSGEAGGNHYRKMGIAKKVKAHTKGRKQN